MKTVFTTLAVLLALAFTWVIPTATVSAAPAEKVAVCHVTDSDALPFPTGHVIDVSKNACVAHCTNHGDHSLVDGACSFAFADSDACIVNPFAGCTVARCIAICEF